MSKEQGAQAPTQDTSTPSGGEAAATPSTVQTQAQDIVNRMLPSRDSGIMWIKGVLTRPTNTLYKGWDKLNQRLVEVLSYNDNPDIAMAGVKPGDLIGYATARWEAREVTATDQHGVETVTHKAGGSRVEGIPLDQM